jgi:hypothetical protein
MNVHSQCKLVHIIHSSANHIQKTNFKTTKDRNGVTNSKGNSDLFLLEGSNKWTPKKWGLYPPKWGVPLKVIYKTCANPFAQSQYEQKKI